MTRTDDHESTQGEAGVVSRARRRGGGWGKLLAATAFATFAVLDTLQPDFTSTEPGLPPWMVRVVWLLVAVCLGALGIEELRGRRSPICWVVARTALGGMMLAALATGALLLL